MFRGNTSYFTSYSPKSLHVEHLTWLSLGFGVRPLELSFGTPGRKTPKNFQPKFSSFTFTNHLYPQPVNQKPPHEKYYQKKETHLTPQNRQHPTDSTPPTDPSLASSTAASVTASPTFGGHKSSKETGTPWPSPLSVGRKDRLPGVFRRPKQPTTKKQVTRSPGGRSWHWWLF